MQSTYCQLLSLKYFEDNEPYSSVLADKLSTAQVKLV
jgi:hypothetical protein